ncbi:hypothetical protein B0X71_03785 [Planococcus lenghuensis]|uniref:Uncharacterized protein n=1 Tax=Planococcus lenghuensis TaxID=2213202 RepID=A0A1Q2KW20_9BACL|nr:hypothetical protein B0X71_03785 [Planococcus lenghuensis]
MNLMFMAFFYEGEDCHGFLKYTQLFLKITQPILKHTQPILKCTYLSLIVTHPDLYNQFYKIMIVFSVCFLILEEMYSERDINLKVNLAVLKDHSTDFKTHSANLNDHSANLNVHLLVFNRHSS